MTNIFSKAPIILASLFVMASTTAATPVAAVFAAPAPVVSSGPELLVGHGVNVVGGTFDVFILETPWFTFGVFNYERANGLAYGGTLDCVYVDGGAAYFTGVVTYSDDPGVGTPPVGLGMGGKVNDNGWGAQDTQSAFAFGPNITPGLCEVQGFRDYLDTAPTLPFVSGDMLVSG